MQTITIAAEPDIIELIANVCNDNQIAYTLRDDRPIIAKHNGRTTSVRMPTAKHRQHVYNKQSNDIHTQTDTGTV